MANLSLIYSWILHLFKLSLLFYFLSIYTCNKRNHLNFFFYALCINFFLYIVVKSVVKTEEFQRYASSFMGNFSSLSWHFFPLVVYTFLTVSPLSLLISFFDFQLTLSFLVETSFYSSAPTCTFNSI